MKITLLLLRILVGAVFIFSGLSKLYPIEIFELNFVYQGIAGWDLAPILARALIIVELFLGVSLLFNSLLKQVILPATILLLLLFTAYLIYTITKDGNSGNCGCFGTLLPMTPLESIVKNVVLLALLVFIYFKIDRTPWRFKWITPTLFVVVSSTIVLLFPIYDYAYAPKKTKNEIADIANITGFKGEPAADLKQGKKLVAVLNMACSHCVEIALKLSAAKTRIKLPPSYYILLGDELSEVKEFYELTNSNSPYIFKHPEDYIKQYKSGWPRVLLLDNGRIKYDNNYKMFNGRDFEKQVSNFLISEN